jgi:uncharacterized membrane protein
VYGIVLLGCAIAFTILTRVILRAQRGRNRRLAAAIGADYKGKLSLACYVAAVPLAFVHQGIADALYVIVALIWLVPDPRIESKLQASEHAESAISESR